MGGETADSPITFGDAVTWLWLTNSQPQINQFAAPK